MSHNGATLRHTASVHSESNQPSVENLKQTLPSELQTPTVESNKRRAAEMIFNMEGSYAARPDSYPDGGYASFQRNSLQLYGAQPLVALSLDAQLGKRMLETCNVASTHSGGSAACSFSDSRSGLMGNVTSEQVQNQWTTPYAPAGDLPQACDKGARR